MESCKYKCGDVLGTGWLFARWHLAPREGTEAHSSLCPDRDGDRGDERASPRRASHGSKIGLGQWWHCHHSVPQPRGAEGTLPPQGPRLSYLGGLGGNARLKSAPLEEAVLGAPAPRWKFPGKNNNDNDNNGIACCQRAAVNRGGGARSSAHLDVLAQPRGVWQPGGLRCPQSEG